MRTSILNIFWIIIFFISGPTDNFGQERRYDKSMLAFSHKFLPTEENIQEFKDKEYETLRIDFALKEDIPKPFWDLKSYNVLDIFHYEMKELPPEIGKMNKIKTLKITSSKLAALPKEIGNLSSLKSLYITAYKLASLPEEIGQLTNLESIQIATLADTFYIPQSVEKLKKLKKLHIEIKSPKLKGYFFPCDSLQSLSFTSAGKSTPFPPNIYTAANLEKLNLRGSFIGITKEIGNLKKLTSLSIYGELISDSTLNIFNFPKLKQLKLRLLTRQLIPDSIINLNSLEECTIRIADYQNLPKGISNCRNLKELFLNQKN